MQESELQNRGMYETEVQRLQREADDYTRALEHERKRFAIVNEEYNQQMKTLEEIRARIKIKIPDETEEHRKHVQRMSLHHHIQNEEVRLNNTIGDNNMLKVQIDIMRKEILFAKDGIRAMQEQIAKLKDQSREAHKESVVAAKTTNEHNNWILSLKAKSEEGKEQFELEVKKLQERLQDPDDTEPTKEDELEKNKADGGKQKFDNPVEILKIRLKNITNKNKEKQRLLNQYTRNARVIEEAFEVIKEGSGIKNLDEIVTTFIKSEEQNYSLWNYVNQLGIECDLFEEQNAQLDRETNKHQSVHNLNKSELKHKVIEMNERAEHLRRQIMQESQEVDQVQEEFDEIQQVVYNLVNQFKRVKFSTKVSQHMQYDNQTQFNENNITLYLAELEEYFASLITYLAVQKGDQHAAISSVPLETLNEKNFDKKELYIEAPYDTTKGDTTTVGDDDEITNAKQLYQKFAEQWSRGQIELQQNKNGPSGPNRLPQNTRADEQ